MRISLKVLSLILCLTFVFTAVPLQAFAEEITETTTVTEPETQPTTKPQKKKKKKAKPKKTKVTGIPQTINKKAEKAASFKITVTPADRKRVVKLQLYNSNKKEYKTVKKYTTKKGKKAKLRITIPDKYRKRTTGKWRIVVNKNKTAKQYVSKPFKVRTCNINNLGLNAKTACIYCVDTGAVLYDKKMNTRRAPASTTKVTTAICVIEQGKFYSNSKFLALARRAPAGRLDGITGDVYRNRDLMHLMLLPSANDAAIVMAWNIAGSNTNFAKIMNKTVKKIGLENTHYMNSFGEPHKEHYSCAYDLARTVAYAGQYADFLSVVRKTSYSFRSIKYRKYYSMVSADKLHGIPGHIGGKTGLSKQAGACYTGLFKYGGKKYAVCVMGCSSKPVRWNDMRKLYSYIRTYGNTKY